MKIAMIVPSLYMGGGEKFTIDLANELAKDTNNQVTLCVISAITKNMLLAHKVNSNVNLISLKKTSGFDYKILFKLKKFLKKNQFDIIHTNLLRTMLYSIWSVLSLKNGNFIHTFHNIVDKEVSSPIHKFILKRLITNFNVVPVGITPKVLEGIQEYFGKEHNNLILNGVTPLTKSHDFEKVQEEISLLKKDTKTKVFINIARVTKVKNQKLLIEAFSQFQKNTILIIIGALDNEAIYAKECQELAKKTSNVIFLGEKSNVGDYLYCSDALCLSSLYEGLPLVILEAMSLGKPTLSTRAGGVPDVIHNERNGFLSQDISIDSYVEIIHNFINYSELNQEEIYSIFNEKYSMAICKHHYYNLYKNTLQEKQL